MWLVLGFVQWASKQKKLLAQQGNLLAPDDRSFLSSSPFCPYQALQSVVGMGAVHLHQAIATDSKGYISLDVDDHNPVLRKKKEIRPKIVGISIRVFFKQYISLLQLSPKAKVPAARDWYPACLHCT